MDAVRAASSPSRAASLDPQFVRMLLQVKRFHRRAIAFLRTTDDGTTSRRTASSCAEGFSDHFVAHYAVPVVSCVWSSGREPRCSTRRGTCSGSWTTTGMLRVTRVAAVVHRRRRLADLRRASRRPAARTCAGRGPSPTSPGDPTASRSVTSRGRSPLRPRRHRDACRPGAGPADRPERPGGADPQGRSATPRNETVLHTDPSVLPQSRQRGPAGTTGCRPAPPRTSPRS